MRVLNGTLKAAAFGVAFGITFVFGSTAVIATSLLVIKHQTAETDKRRKERLRTHTEFNKMVQDWE